MQPFKILKLIFQILAGALFLGSLVFCGINIMTAETTYIDPTAAFTLAESSTGTLADAAFLAFLTMYVGIFAFAAVGVFLLSAKTDIAKRIGHGFVLSSFAIGLTGAILYLESSVSAVVMLLAVISLALYYLCELILKIMQKNEAEIGSPEDDIRIVHVKQWKEIMEEGIISPEEFEEKRCQILGIKPKQDKPKETK